ncbi:transglycosylase SLT domain-containing protein [Spirochaetota bacterium]
MKFNNIIIAALIIISIIFGHTNEALSWDLYKMIINPTDKKDNLKLQSFIPERDIHFLPPLKSKEIFQSINDLSICRKKKVRKFIFLYLTKGRNFLKNAIRRSYIYHDIIREIFTKNKDVPIEISLLPLLESSFSPFAVSKSNAVGLWQFVPNTSKPLGLKRNRWIDERRDIEKSTIAAIRHIKNSYRFFRSWELALAAYNGGNIHVYRAIKKTGTKNFWELSDSGALRKETSEFLPKFIALVIIYKNQKLFGIHEEIEKPTTYITKNVTFNYPANIKYISKFSKIPLNILLQYNPELKKKYLPPNTKKYSFRMPVEGIKRLSKYSKKLYRYRYKYRRVSKYIVKRGDTISEIARKYKRSTRIILRYNKIRRPQNIRPGRIIYIPFR